MSAPESETHFKPYVADEANVREFTFSDGKRVSREGDSRERVRTGGHVRAAV